jgi:hypothetical protein
MSEIKIIFMYLPLYSALYFLMSGVFFFFTFKLQQAYQKTRSILGLYFRNVALFSGIAAMIYSLMGIFFPKNSFALGVGNIIGEPFYLIGFIYVIAAFFYMTFPKISQKKVIMIGFVLVILTVISHIRFFPYPFIDERGILHFNAPIIPGLTFSAFSSSALLPMIFALSKEAIQKKNLRKKSAFIAGSLLLFFVAGIIQSMFEEPWLYALSFFVQALASAFLFIGIISRVKEIKEY